MTKRNKAVLIVLSLLLLAGIAVFLLCSNQEGFTGSRIKNPDAYSLDIEKMNGTDLHTLELQEGDVLQIEFETEKGELYMEIKAPDGTAVYRGNGKEKEGRTNRRLWDRGYVSGNVLWHGHRHRPWK